MTIETSTKLGRYEIRSKIGEGGMGEVYRARDTQLGRDVAIKVIPSSVAVDKDRLQRFEQEACAAGALNHPNILVVHDIAAHDGSPGGRPVGLEVELQCQLNQSRVVARRGDAAEIAWIDDLSCNRVNSRRI